MRQARHPAARDEPLPVELLDRSQARDVLLLAACYDQSTAENRRSAGSGLRQKLRFPTWRAKWDSGPGHRRHHGGRRCCSAGCGDWAWFGTALAVRWLIAAGWCPWLWRLAKSSWRAWQITRNTRVLSHEHQSAAANLMSFPGRRSLSASRCPPAQRTDDRYELLAKLQGVLRSLRFDGILVLVDRVDEPYLINGSTELMQALVWPMLDNKFLKHPGMGLKLLLPIELERLLDRQERDFHQRARLDKQNLVRSLAWTGQSLYDLANARLKACAAAAANRRSLGRLVRARVDDRRLKEALGTLAGAAAPVQVHVPALHRPLQRP